MKTQISNTEHTTCSLNLLLSSASNKLSDRWYDRDMAPCFRTTSTFFFKYAYIEHVVLTQCLDVVQSNHHVPAACLEMVTLRIQSYGYKKSIAHVLPMFRITWIYTYEGMDRWYSFPRLAHLPPPFPTSHLLPEVCLKTLNEKQILTKLRFSVFL